jgi:hypothetical protein
MGIGNISVPLPEEAKKALASVGQMQKDIAEVKESLDALVSLMTKLVELQPESEEKS